jgi:hypothetical protein
VHTRLGEVHYGLKGHHFLMRIALEGCIVLLSLLCSAQAAVILTPTITPSGENSSYDYTVFNTEPLGIILLELELPVNPVAVEAPTDWTSNTFSTGSSYFVQWVSTVSEIAPNSSLSGFVVVAAADSGPVPFNATDIEFNMTSGITTGPAIPIPEPSMMLPALLALTAGFLIRRKYS